MTDLRDRVVGGVLCAALLTLAGCGDDASAPPPTSSSPSTAVDEEQAYAEVKKVDTKFRAHDQDEPLAADTTWASDAFRKQFNDDVAKREEQGLTRKGSTKVTGIHPSESKPEAPGGWDLSIFVCSTSTVRLYDKDGKDMTGDPSNPGQPLPPGPRDNVHLMSFTTPDDGTTWQLDKMHLIPNKYVEETPCAKN